MSSFAITAATRQVTLEQAGTAQVSFTVANTSAQNVRARVLTKPLPPTRPAWLSVIGEPIRNLPAGAGQQVIVPIHVPSHTPTGSYSFRLTAVSETAPDEDFAESPAVAFNVTAPKSKKRFPWLILAAIALVAAAANRAVRRRQLKAERAPGLFRRTRRLADQQGRPMIRKVPGTTKWN